MVASGSLVWVSPLHWMQMMHCLLQLEGGLLGLGVDIGLPQMAG